MTAGLPENVQLQITPENRNGKVNQTTLLSKTEMILELVG